jgi:hypothetical protein
MYLIAVIDVDQRAVCGFVPADCTERHMRLLWHTQNVTAGHRRYIRTERACFSPCCCRRDGKRTSRSQSQSRLGVHSANVVL